MKDDRLLWGRRFLRGVLLWILPVALVWTVITPSYNTFLTISTENLVRLTESPNVTRLLEKGRDHFVITRTDFPTSDGWLFSVRTTDAHFNFIMLWAFFLAVPGVPWKLRLENLLWATLLAACFHIVLLLCWVKFAYATQIPELGANIYSSFKINFWGLSKHLLDLPFKFALPFLLWAGFYIRNLLPEPVASTE